MTDEEKENGPNNFFIVTRWTSTAMSGGGLGQGDPTIVTWSIVPNGTDANGGPGFVPSNLITVFDNLFNEPNAGTPDLTNRFWHGLIEQSLDRWAELSGVVYVYEPNDDGVANFGANGVVGVRGDVRIGGFNIDGPNGILAFNDFPNVGDMAIDTSDTAVFGNSGLNFRLFRNVFCHEQGHGLGFAHLESNNAAFLMEPFISGGFDGPQLDDVRAVHRNYGDVFEKSNNFAGNNTIANATDLGTLADGDNVTIGIDGSTGTVVNINDIDFVSIDDNLDQDFYRVNLTQSSLVDITLTPVGAPYNQSMQGGAGNIPVNPVSVSDLSLRLFNSTGGLIQLVNANGVGLPETIMDQAVPAGNIFIQVSGNADNIQLYTLSVTAETISEPDSNPPSVVDVNPGTISAGSVADLANSDDQRLEIQPEAPDVSIGAVFTIITPNSIPSTLSVTYEGAGDSFNLNQTMSLFNQNTGLFEMVDSRVVPLTEDSILISPTGDPQRFVQFGSGLILMDLQYEPTGPVLLFPWTIELDQLLINTTE